MKDKHLEWRQLFYFTQLKNQKLSKRDATMFWGQHCSWLSTIYFPFHASHKARVFRECENKNMKIFTSVASIWYVEDSKIDFKNENTAHGNRLLLFYKSKIIEIEKDEYFSDNCKKYSHCSTNSKPNSAYCSSTNSHCLINNITEWQLEAELYSVI